MVALVDALATMLVHAYQLTRVRLPSVASPVIELLRRELAILRASRQAMSPHKRPDYHAEQRLAILQLKRHRGWSINKTARRFVIHPNTLRSWIDAIEGRGKISLLEDAIRWNRIDDVVRWAAHELRRLCPEPEFGTRTIARHLVRASIAVRRSTVQRVMREEKPKRPTPRKRRPTEKAAGVPPHDLLTPAFPNHVWHMDFTAIRILWFGFTVAAILDGFSRKLLAFQLLFKTPKQVDAARIVRTAIREHGKPSFLITDHGTQFSKRFQADIESLGVSHVKGRVLAPYLNGKIERAFRTFKLWWRVILCGLFEASIQKRLDTYGQWYNNHRPHSAVGGLTPDEAWSDAVLPQPTPIRCRDPVKTTIRPRRIPCRGDPNLPVIQITLNRAA